MIRPSLWQGRQGAQAPIKNSATAGWSRAWRLGLRRMPGPCALCGQRCRGELCQPCRQQVQGSLWPRACRCCAAPIAPGSGSPLCTACAVDLPAFETAVVAMAYCPPADTLVLQLKGGKRYGRARILAELLAIAWRHAALDLPAASWVVPIPASATALRQRGFNPAGEIAAALSGQLGLGLRRDVLLWRGPDQAQSQRGQGREHRLARRSAFMVRPEVQGLAGRCVVLVDDVMTTGATLDGAARALRQAGAARVVAAAVARTPPPGWTRRDSGHETAADRAALVVHESL